jgi:hypothetical protein
MKTALALLLSFAAISCAQDRRPEDKDKKRLSTVTWDLKSHKLIWEIQTGRDVDGEFEANATSRYEISPDEAVMAVASERRAFTEAEAASLHKLLDTLSLYCAESVVWWNQGQGRRLKEGEPGKGRPAHPEPNRNKPSAPGGVKVSDPTPQKATPAARVALRAAR